MKHVAYLLIFFAQFLIAQEAPDSLQLDRAVQKLLAVPSSGIDSPPSARQDYNLAVEAVDRLGTDDEIRATLWKILNDVSQAHLWLNAMGECYRYQALPETLATWVRKHLDRILLESEPTLSYAMLVLGRATVESDAELLKNSAEKLPPASDGKKKILLTMAESVPQRVKDLLDGMTRMRKWDELAAKGDRSPDVLNWIKKKEGEQKMSELQRKYKEALRAGATAADARKAAFESLSNKPVAPPK